jgi:hypothetical protein
MKKVEEKMHFFKRIPYSNTLLPVRRNFNRHDVGVKSTLSKWIREEHYLCRKGCNGDSTEEGPEPNQIENGKWRHKCTLLPLRAEGGERCMQKY